MQSQIPQVNTIDIRDLESRILCQQGKTNSEYKYYLIISIEALDLALRALQRLRLFAFLRTLEACIEDSAVRLPQYIR